MFTTLKQSMLILKIQTSLLSKSSRGKQTLNQSNDFIFLLPSEPVCPKAWGSFTKEQGKARVAATHPMKLSGKSRKQMSKAELCLVWYPASHQIKPSRTSYINQYR